MSKTTTILAALALAAGVTVGGAAQAQAVTYKTFSCSPSGWPAGRGAEFLRSNFGGGKTSIFGTASYPWKQSRTTYDVTWTFYRFTSSTGLQTRYENDTTWGGSAGNRLPATNETITTEFRGRNALGGTYSAKCTTTVGL